MLGATEIAARIRSRSLSSLDLTEAYIERIERLDHFNAFETRSFDLARAQARAADDELRRGH